MFVYSVTYIRNVRNGYVFVCLGESVPVTKVPLPNPQLGTPSDLGVTFNLKEHGRHVLFCGTKIVQTRYYSDERVRAVVLRTGI